MAPPPGLYLITDPDAGDQLVERVARGLAAAGAHGPAVAVQLRAKAWPTARLLATGRALRAITREHGARLLINDRADVAVLCQADGIQLPESGMTVPEARSCLGQGAVVGVSCHDLAGLRRAARAGADFATLSPVHGVPQKGPALGLAGFAALCQETPLPVIALGGLTPTDAGPLRAAGASGVAAIRSILGAEDVESAMTAWCQAWFGTDDAA